MRRQLRHCRERGWNGDILDVRESLTCAIGAYF